jgi:hypothetical protein
MRRACLFVGCLALFFGACGSHDETPTLPNPALGKWQLEHGGTWEFRPDGSVSMTAPKGKEIHMHCRVLDARTLEVSPKEEGGKGFHMTVEAVGGDDLVVTGPKGTHKLHRIK